MSDNRLPSLPDGKARVFFEKTSRGSEKVILLLPTWLNSYNRQTGAPVTITKFKRLNVIEPSLVDKFRKALEAGWFIEEIGRDGEKYPVIHLTNIKYFDNSFQNKEKAWINFSQLVSADIIEVAEPDEY